jgi:hypothetical protein
MGSLVRFENKNIFFYFEKRCSLKSEVVGLTPGKKNVCNKTLCYSLLLGIIGLTPSAYSLYVLVVTTEDSLCV